jgi:hypothetical protein
MALVAWLVVSTPSGIGQFVLTQEMTEHGSKDETVLYHFPRSGVQCSKGK